jgi:small subunit ribosomal protein S8
MAAISDPIADMLTRIRNAIMAGHYSLTLPASKMKNHIAKILQEEGYINNFEFREDGPQGAIHITLNYSKAGKSPILGLKRVS